MTQATLFQQINDYKNRANPYPLYTELLKTPITCEPDGSYVISSYRLITELLHDPRLSSSLKTKPADLPFPVSFLRLDPPEHDRLRRQVMRQFGPPHTTNLIDAMKDELKEIVNDLLDHLQGRSRIDIVDDYAYPFPVTVICKLLGVPPEDEPRFHVWADELVVALDPPLQTGGGDRPTINVAQVSQEIGQYMAELIEKHRQHPGNDMLSRLITDDGPDGPIDSLDLISTSILLLIAGHETTVNLITNGMLTLLRNPDVLERLRKDPALVVPLVEELLRFEPPVHFNSRIAATDITLDGIAIPEGATIYPILAAGNRDPERFPEPNRFIPDREDNQHFGFGSGIHYCFGAPLARLEVQIALTALVSRIENPGLVIDPPPYRQGAVLRGPRHLLVDVDSIGLRV